MNRLRYANLLELVSSENGFSNPSLKTPSCFPPEGKPKVDKKDFSDPRSKNPRLFPLEGTEQRKTRNGDGNKTRRAIMKILQIRNNPGRASPAPSENLEN